MADPTLTNPIASSKPHHHLRAKEEEPDLRECAIPRISTYTPPGYTYVASDESVKKEAHESGKKEEKDYILKRESRTKKIKQEKIKRRKIACGANGALSVESSGRSRSRGQIPIERIDSGGKSREGERYTPCAAICVFWNY